MITIVGVGPGSPDYLAPIGRKAIEAADIIAAGADWLGRLSGHPAEKIDIQPIAHLVDRLKEEGNVKRIVVLVSGDPGLFSLLHVIKRDAPALSLAVVPGISAAQVLFARLALDWSEVDFVSLHGRTFDNLDKFIARGAKVCVFTDAVNTPGKVGRVLAARGFSGKAVVGEDLTGPDEAIREMGLDKLAIYETARMSLVYLEIE